MSTQDVENQLGGAEPFKQAALSSVKLPGEVGETSDGYHTFNELYEHRHRLFIALCAHVDSWKSRLHDDGSFLEGWFIAGINTPQGQATYHLPNRLWDDLKAPEMANAPKWDGHTSNDVLDRLAILTPSTMKHPAPVSASQEVVEKVAKAIEPWLPSPEFLDANNMGVFQENRIGCAKAAIAALATLTQTSTKE